MFHPFPIGFLIILISILEYHLFLRFHYLVLKEIPVCCLSTTIYLYLVVYDALINCNYVQKCYHNNVILTQNINNFTKIKFDNFHQEHWIFLNLERNWKVKSTHIIFLCKSSSTSSNQTRNMFVQPHGLGVDWIQWIYISWELTHACVPK